MAVTVTYKRPVSGTVAPTAAQSANCNMVNAQLVYGADGDTTATVTHNFGLSTTEIAEGFPIVILTRAASGTASSTVNVDQFTSTNVITITKSADTGSAGTFNVTILRPYSAMT